MFIEASILHSAKVQQNGYLCNSRFVKVVKRTSSLRLVDDGHSLCSAKDALNQGVAFRDGGFVLCVDMFSHSVAGIAVPQCRSQILSRMSGICHLTYTDLTERFVQSVLVGLTSRIE